jgi:hypothetical protein
VVSAIGVATCELTTSWQKFKVEVSIPSISGKTLGTSNDDYLDLNIWFDAGSDYNSRTNSLGQQSGTFDIAQVQLQAGETATPFADRSEETEKGLCLRYYEKSKGNERGCGVWNGYAVNDSPYYYDVPFAVEKRATPTITNSNNTAAGFPASASTLNGASVKGFRLTRTCNATGNSRYFADNWEADAEL